jgi:hypothetical protein
MLIFNTIYIYLSMMNYLLNQLIMIFYFFLKQYYIGKKYKGFFRRNCVIHVRAYDEGKVPMLDSYYFGAN